MLAIHRMPGRLVGHQLTDGTVMIRGMVGDPWGIEGTERVEWFFEQLP